MIDLCINGENRQIKSSTVAALINELDLANRRVAVELNKQIVSRERYETTALSAGDNIEVVHFVGGG
jgi:thiamine biosynthesis protein ThiS